jgi:hypothetical protein
MALTSNILEIAIAQGDRSFERRAQEGPLRYQWRYIQTDDSVHRMLPCKVPGMISKCIQMVDIYIRGVTTTRHVASRLVRYDGTIDKYVVTIYGQHFNC